MLYRAILGQLATSDANFSDSRGQALVPTSPPTFVVRDFNKLIVVAQTVAVQDGTDPSTWRASFTLPTNAPVPTAINQKYQIEWIMPLADGQKATAIERFDVIAPGDPVFASRKTDILAIAGRDLSDRLFITDAPTAKPVFRVLDLAGRIIATGDVTGPMAVDDGWGYTAYIPANRMRILDPFMGMCPYTTEWEWTPQGSTPATESHAIWLIDYYIMTHIHGLKALVDRGRLGRAHPDLNWSDADLMCYLVHGLNRINGAGNIITNWTLATVPNTALHLLYSAAADRALAAQMMAENYMTFDLQAGNVSLNTEQIMQGLDSVRNAIAEGLNDQITQYKKAYVGGGYPLTGAPPGTGGMLVPNRVAATVAVRIGQHQATNLYAYQGWRNTYTWFLAGILPYGGIGGF